MAYISQGFSLEEVAKLFGHEAVLSDAENTQCNGKPYIEALNMKTRINTA